MIASDIAPVSVFDPNLARPLSTQTCRVRFQPIRALVTHAEVSVVMGKRLPYREAIAPTC